MTDIKKQLYDAFQADHAALGQGLHNIRVLISEGNAEAVRDVAYDLIQSSGAHIAFEEFDFYPALKSMLSEKEVSNMYLEHAEGLQLLQKLSAANDNAFSSNEYIQDILKELDVLDHHVADCGNLFGAMGGLKDADYVRLMDRLSYWRKRAPSWSEIETLPLSQDGL